MSWQWFLGQSGYMSQISLTEVGQGNLRKDCLGSASGCLESVLPTKSQLGGKLKQSVRLVSRA